MRWNQVDGRGTRTFAASSRNAPLDDPPIVVVVVLLVVVVVDAAVVVVGAAVVVVGAIARSQQPRASGEFTSRIPGCNVARVR